MPKPNKDAVRIHPDVARLARKDLSLKIKEEPALPAVEPSVPVIKAGTRESTQAEVRQAVEELIQHGTDFIVHVTYLDPRRPQAVQVRHVNAAFVSTPDIIEAATKAFDKYRENLKDLLRAKQSGEV